MSKPSNSQSESSYFLLLLLASVAGYALLKKLMTKSNLSLREQADEYIRTAVIDATAKQFNWPVATISRILQQPESDPKRWQALQAAWQDCRVTFAKQPQDINVTILINWTETESITIRQRWQWRQLPADIREGLLTREAVTVHWEMPEVTPVHL